MESEDLFSFNIREDESDLFIAADTPIDPEIAIEALASSRAQIKDYIKKNPEFSRSLSPLREEAEVFPIIKRMFKASTKVGVGPMASVAGAIAEDVGKKLLRHSSQIIIENGGDLFISTAKERRVGLYTAKGEFKNLIIRVDPSLSPLGICSSSSTLGPSLSLGNVDLAFVMAQDASLADAAATALGNKVKSKKNTTDTLQLIHSIEGVYAALVIIEGQLSVIGGIEFYTD